MRTTHLLIVVLWGVYLGRVSRAFLWADTPQDRHLPVDRILDTRLWKHYLPATTIADGKNFKETDIERISN